MKTVCVLRATKSSSTFSFWSVKAVPVLRASSLTVRVISRTTPAKKIKPFGNFCNRSGKVGVALGETAHQVN